MKNLLRSRQDFIYLSLIFAIALLIFYPVFFNEYVYSDELPGLWQFNRDENYQSVLIPQGRYITQKMADLLYGSTTTIRQLVYIRVFSFCGWIISIPIWYFIIKRIAVKENLPTILAFFSTLYLVCTPPFTVYISWAACMELFLANTAGLLSGYLLYISIRNQDGRIHVSGLPFISSVIFGIVSLFTYQNGFGCFLIPFLLCLVANVKLNRNLVIGLCGYLFIILVYYALFKYSLRFSTTGPIERANIVINPIGKLKFFFARPLSTSFHFTYIFNQKSIPGLLVYGLLFIGWISLVFVQRRILLVLDRLKYLLMVLFIFILIYLPSLVVKENYASNRTMLALNMAVFIAVAYELLNLFNSKQQKYFVFALSLLFVANGWFNFNKGFLQPVVNEYTQLRTHILTNYKSTTDTVYFIRPRESYFAETYGISSSWDEFGVPSGFFDWTPEFLTKQLVFEQTGDRVLADKIVVKSWESKEAYLKSGLIAGENALLVDEEELLKK